jgi:hypothetical protein
MRVLLAALLIAVAYEAHAQTTSDKLRVVVVVIPSKNFKTKYKSDYYTDTDEGRRYAYWIQEDLIDGLNHKLNSRNKCGVWDAELCDCTEDFNKAIAKPDAYISMRVEIVERKYRSRYRSSNRSYAELTVDCEIHRKTGVAWEKVYANRIRTRSGDPDEEEHEVTSLDNMVAELDNLIVDRMVPYRIVNAMAKDADTKIINLQVMNTTPCTIERLTWTVPAGNEDYSVVTRVAVEPGEVKNLSLTIKSETSHAALGWRNTRLSDISFSR